MPRSAVCGVLILLAVPALAQVNGGTAIHTFTPGTVIQSSQVNANFARLFSDALDRTGGTMTGTLTVLNVVPAADATYNLGSPSLRFNNIYVTNAIASGGSGSFSNTVTVTTSSGNPQLELYFNPSNFLKLKADGTGLVTYDATTSHNFLDPVSLSSTLQVTGNATVDGQILMKDGSASSPGLAFASSTNTGFFKDATYTFGFSIAGQLYGGFKLTSGASTFDLAPRTYGTGNISGSIFGLGNNMSGNGAAGTLAFYQKTWNSNTDWRFVWVDGSGLLRIHTAAPLESGLVPDNAGTVVGDQTSSRSAKQDLLRVTDSRGALELLLRTPIYRFRYADGRYNGETFIGVVTDYAPWLGKDQNKSLNEINAIGLLILALQAQQAEIDALRAELARRP